MAVVSVKQDFKGRSSSETADSRTATEKYIVRTDAFSDGPVVARRAAGVPKLNDTHSQDSLMRVQDVKAEPLQDDPLVFTVTVEYATVKNSEEDDETPLDLPPVYRFGFAVSTEPKYTDINRKTMTNSAGETFDPPPEIEVFDALINVEKNIATFDASLATYLIGGVNGEAWIGVPPRCARVNNVSASQEFYTDADGNDVEYWKLNLEIECRVPDPHTGTPGWDLQMIDQGYVELVDNGSGGKIQRLIRDKDGQPKNTPSLLNGAGLVAEVTTFDTESGIQLASGQPPTFIPFQIYREVSFALLGI